MSILTKEGSVLDIAGSSGISIDIKQLLANIRNDLHKPQRDILLNRLGFHFERFCFLERLVYYQLKQ